MTELKDKRIVITGLTGQVGKQVALALAPENEVLGVARFSDPAAKAALETAGIECVTADLGNDSLDHLPDDVDYVLHFAVAKTQDFDADLTANAEGTGRLMSRYQNAIAFLHCSSTAVYQPNGRHAFSETDPLGDNHRVASMSFMPTYSICKIAAEATARYCAREFGLPTTIARLNVPYGAGGGWPWLHLEQVLSDQPIVVHTDAPSVFNPIHDDDIVATLPALLTAASAPATIVNWAGSEEVSVEDWTNHFAEMAGKTATFEHRDDALQSVVTDTTKLQSLGATATVPWREGMRHLAETFHPELFR